MMIIDMSQIAISNIMVQHMRNKINEFPLPFVRFLVLDALQKVLGQFKKDYGQVIIAIDGSRSWRKDVFEHYKYGRSEERQKAAAIDWKDLFQNLNTVYDEIRDNFPYIVLNIKRAEADDVIGTLVRHYHENQMMEPILIISGDKDFKQLHLSDRVRQFSPVLRKFLGVGDREAELFEHICKGDFVDKIPNVYCGDTHYVVKGKKGKVTAGRLEAFRTTPQSEWPEQQLRNFKRNEQLIDLTHVPSEIQASIIEEHDKQKGAFKRADVFNYLVKNRMSELMGAASNF